MRRGQVRRAGHVLVFGALAVITTRLCWLGGTRSCVVLTYDLPGGHDRKHRDHLRTGAIYAVTTAAAPRRRLRDWTVASARHRSPPGSPLGCGAGNIRQLKRTRAALLPLHVATGAATRHLRRRIDLRLLRASARRNTH